MDWFTEQAWSAWLALALFLGVAELFSLDLVLLMLAMGALVGAVLGAFDLPIVVQCLGAAATATAMLVFVRPTVVRRLHAGPELKQGFAALVGTTGYVLGEVSDRGGQVKVSGEVWTARPYLDGMVIPQGAKVEVLEIKGATAYVHQVAELEG